jgi:hypothetical protein
MEGLPRSDLDQVPLVRLRTRSVVNLPPVYRFVYVDIQNASDGSTWSSQKVEVVKGAAVVDLWARVPVDARVKVQVRTSDRTTRLHP